MNQRIANANMDNNLGGAWGAREHPGPRVPLFGSGVPHDSPLEGHSQWDPASTTHGIAMRSQFNLILHW